MICLCNAHLNKFAVMALLPVVRELFYLRRQRISQRRGNDYECSRYRQCIQLVAAACTYARRSTPTDEDEQPNNISLSSLGRRGVDRCVTKRYTPRAADGIYKSRAQKCAVYFSSGIFRT